MKPMSDRPFTLDPTAREEEPVGPPELLAEYAAGPELLRSAVTGLSADELRLRPIPGRWSTLEVVCHISDTEQFFADRLKRTLAMERPLLVGADGWRYPESVRYHDRDPEEELALVRLTRLQVSRILHRVPDPAWQRTAVHTELGLVTLHQLLLHAIGHLKHHLAFIEEKRQALATAGSPSPTSLQPPGATTRAPSNSHEIGRRGDFLISTDPDLLDLAVIHDFLCNRSYWAAGRPLEVVRSSVEGSLCFGLYHRGRQVGFARVVTDRATFGWLADVFVLEEYRGQGLSKWLMGCIVQHPELQGLRRLLLGTRDAHGLYQQFGFTPLPEPERFMEIFRENIYRTDRQA
jgi:GNAT superfamily N-acetyltransferase